MKTGQHSLIAIAVIMSSGFTGAERLDERRRRRLVSEMDDPSNGDGAPNADDRQTLPSPDGVTRGLDAPQTDRVTGLDYAVKPAGWVISPKIWKHFAAAAVLWLTGLGITWVGTVESDWTAQFGPGVSRLFGNAGTARPWFGGVLLLAASQLALWIWWMRRQSFRDFAGSYRVWPWTVSYLFAVSFGTATGAHLSLRDLVGSIRPEWSDLIRNVCWIGPTLTIGALLTAALQREMRGCRASLWLLQLAGLLTLVQATLSLELIRLADVTWHAALEQTTLVTIQVFTLLSLALHLRHVSYFSAEPTEASQRRFRIPKPHFRWAALLKFRKAKLAEDDTDDESPRRRSKKRRKRKVAKRTQRPSTDNLSPDADEDEGDDDSISPATSQPPRRIGALGSSIIRRLDDAEEDSESESEDEENWDDAPASNERDTASQSDDENDADESDGDDGSYDDDADDLPSLRRQASSPGLSKKQRRKLQNRIRDLERQRR